MDYSLFLKKGLLYTIKNILEEIKNKNHNFNIFITLDNTHTDSLVSIRLKELYPNEMCIGLYNQYSKLEICSNYFQVQLNFNGLDELIRMPYSTILKFEDSDNNFQLDLREIKVKENDVLNIEENVISIDFNKDN